MSGSPVAALVRAWVRLYTSGLPAPLRDARRDEVDDDLWCEHAEATALGRSARSLGADLVLRLLFGIPADISWRMTRRGSVAPLHRERHSSTTRLGALAIAAGLCYGILLILFIPFSDALWTGDFGLVGMVVTLAGVIAFAASAVGIVLRFQDRVSPFGAVGALLVSRGRRHEHGRVARAAPDRVSHADLGPQSCRDALATLGHRALGERDPHPRCAHRLARRSGSGEWPCS